MKTLSAITEQTMSSREIAELTGKELINLLSKDDSVQNHKQYQDVRDNHGYVREYNNRKQNMKTLPVWADQENDEGYKTPKLSEVFGDRAEKISKEFAVFVQELRNQGEVNIDSFRIAEGLNKPAMGLYDTYMFGANYGH